MHITRNSITNRKIIRLAEKKNIKYNGILYISFEKTEGITDVYTLKYSNGFIIGELYARGGEIVETNLFSRSNLFDIDDERYFIGLSINRNITSINMK